MMSIEIKYSVCITQINKKINKSATDTMIIFNLKVLIL